MLFSEKLKKLREDAGLERIDLAKILNISRSAISNYENGHRKPENDELWKNIADYFNVSVDYLMKDDYDVPNDDMSIKYKNSKFKDILKFLREKKGITQEDLGKIIGVTGGTIGNYEQGQRMPQNDILWLKLARYFNVSVDYLMTGKDYSAPHIIAADTITTEDSPIILHTDNENNTPDPAQLRRNALADKIRNSDYTEEQIDKIEQMINLII